MKTGVVHTACPARHKGFSLIEVLIALMIVSVALAAFARVGLQSTDHVEYMEQKGLAMMSARNELAQWQAGVWPLKPGASSHPCPQAGWPFVCRSQVRAAAPGLLALSIQVDLGHPAPRRLASLQTQLARDTLP